MEPSGGFWLYYFGGIIYLQEVVGNEVMSKYSCGWIPTSAGTTTYKQGRTAGFPNTGMS